MPTSRPAPESPGGPVPTPAPTGAAGTAAPGGAAEPGSPTDGPAASAAPSGSTGVESGAPAGGGQAELQERLRRLEEENASLKDQLLRSLADFENFRKRMAREREEAVRYANASLLSDLIAIIDDFERAIQSGGASKDFDSFHSGVTMIERQLVGMLERNWGLKRFQSIGEEFDPEKHQAIMVEPVRGQAKPMVLEDFQRGYRLHDRVLRPAKVKVSQPEPEAVSDPGQMGTRRPGSDGSDNDAS